MADDTATIVKMQCVECGGWPKNHRVVRDLSRSWCDDDYGVEGGTSYQICQCQGCDHVGFREVSWSSDSIDEESGDPIESVAIYPEFEKTEWKSIETRELPPAVSGIYRETIAAFNAAAFTLAGGGLRAIVEAICLDQKVVGRNLQAKIDDLVAKNLLAGPQAALLHEERYIGNLALHELRPPSRQELSDGLRIVEGLLNTIYVLPKHADKLRKSRTK